MERIGAPADSGCGPILLPAGYVAEDVQLGYGSTVHAAQGITVDTAYNLTGGGTRLDAAAQYVAQTRGRDLNIAIVALGKPPAPDRARPRTARGGQLRIENTSRAATPRQVLAAALTEATTEHSWHKPGPGVAATVAAEQDLAHHTSMTTLTARIESETRLACRTRLEAHLDDAVHAGILDEPTRARLGGDQASEHLSRLLRVVEQDGHDPRDVLNHVLTHGRSLVDARSPAQVLAHRITRGRPDHDLTDPAPAGRDRRSRPVCPNPSPPGYGTCRSRPPPAPPNSVDKPPTRPPNGPSAPSAPSPPQTMWRIGRTGNTAPAWSPPTAKPSPTPTPPAPWTACPA